jgi:hypothetical protein
MHPEAGRTPARADHFLSTVHADKSTQGKPNAGVVPGFPEATNFSAVMEEYELALRTLQLLPVVLHFQNGAQFASERDYP